LPQVSFGNHLRIARSLQKEGTNSKIGWTARRSSKTFVLRMLHSHCLVHGTLEKAIKWNGNGPIAGPVISGASILHRSGEPSTKTRTVRAPTNCTTFFTPNRDSRTRHGFVQPLRRQFGTGIANIHVISTPLLWLTSSALPGKAVCKRNGCEPLSRKTYHDNSEPMSNLVASQLLQYRGLKIDTF
jgi:hypothetical protein